MRTATLYCFLLLLGHHISYSQDSQLDTIPWSIDLDDVVVTAQYAPTDSRSAVHRVRIIQQEEIAQRGVVNLEQLLRQELNIRISQDLVLGSSLNLQGISGQNVQIMIDGIPIIGRVGDDIDLSQVNLNNIERVEIVDAPLSVNYGTNALGGVINLITKKSQLHRFDTQVEYQQESIGRKNLNAALGVRPTKKLLIRFQGGYNKFDGFDNVKDSIETDERSFQWNPKEQYFAGGSVRYDFAKEQHIRYAINWFDEEVINLGSIRRPQFKPYAFDDYYYTTRHDHSLHQEGAIGDNYFLKTTIGYNYFQRKKNTYRFDFDTEEKSELANEQDTTRFNAWVFRPVLASRYSDKKLNFQAGIDIRYEDALGQRINDESSNKENFSEISDYAVFGSIQYQAFDQLVLQAGARIAYNSRFDAPVVPSFNLKYALSENLTLRFSYAKGFRSPSLKELFFYFVDANHFILGNADLKAETSNNYQLSLDWQTKIKSQHFEASATAFFNDIKHKIDLYQYVEIDGKLVPAAEVGQTSTQYAYFNQSRYKTVGGNLRLNYTVKNLSLNLGCSPIGRYNLLSESTDDVSPFTFVFETNGNISYRFPKQALQLSLYIRHNDKLIRYFQDYDDEDNPVTGELIQDGFTLSDFTLSKYFWKKRIQFIGGVQNIFDVRNVPFSGGSGGAHSGGGSSTPVGMGRSWFVRLSWQFGWGS